MIAISHRNTEGVRGTNGRTCAQIPYVPRGNSAKLESVTLGAKHNPTKPGEAEKNAIHADSASRHIKLQGEPCATYERFHRLGIISRRQTHVVGYWLMLRGALRQNTRTGTLIKSHRLESYAFEPNQVRVMRGMQCDRCARRSYFA